jgi:hypothetical protein
MVADELAAVKLVGAALLISYVQVCCLVLFEHCVCVCVCVRARACALLGIACTVRTIWVCMSARTRVHAQSTYALPRHSFGLTLDVIAQ